MTIGKFFKSETGKAMEGQGTIPQNIKTLLTGITCYLARMPMLAKWPNSSLKNE